MIMNLNFIIFNLDLYKFKVYNKNYARNNDDKYNFNIDIKYNFKYLTSQHSSKI